MASPKSRPLTRRGAAGGLGPWAGAGGAGALAGAAVVKPGRCPGGGGGTGAEAALGAAEAATAGGGGGGAVAGAGGAAPPAGRVGSLMVAVGLGGKLMRTVSFFGCTLAASPGFGGTGPAGGLGTFSAINQIDCLKLVLG